MAVLSLMICFGPIIIDGHLVYLQKILDTLRGAAILLPEPHEMEHPNSAASASSISSFSTPFVYNTIRSAYLHSRHQPPVVATIIPIPAGAPSAYYSYFNSYHPSPLTPSSAALATTNGYASDWTPIVPVGLVRHQHQPQNREARRKQPPKKTPSASARPFERTEGTKRYIDICMITTTGAYAIPTDPAGVQPFCPYWTGSPLCSASRSLSVLHRVFYSH